MASRKFKFDGVKESSSISISKYNEKEGTQYFLFDPKNITNYKSKEGRLAGKLVYLFEFLQCMWGNDEIYEYVIIDNKIIENLNLSQYGKVSKTTIENVTFEYAFKRGLFSRYIYNALIKIKDVYYYIYVKTINNNNFYNLIKEFILNPYNKY